MIIALRFFGKKELSQLNTADVILILFISNAVQNAMVGSNTTLLGGIVAATVLFVINFTFKKLMFKYKGFSAFLQEKPEILIHNGIIEFTSLSKLNIENTKRLPNDSENCYSITVKSFFYKNERSNLHLLREIKY